MANKRVYECLNSTGFDDPFVVMEIDNTSIKLLMKIDAEVITLVNNDSANPKDNASLGSDFLGDSLTFEEEPCLLQK